MKIDLQNPYAISRMRNLFIDYHPFPRRHGLSWLLDKSEKLSVKLVLSSIRPYKLLQMLESDIAFSHAHLKVDAKAFLTYARKLSKTFYSGL